MVENENDTSSTNGSHAFIARRFLAIRLELGLSQQAFADALNISLRGEQNYERGVRKLPSDILLELARKFQIDPIWVLEGPEERPRYLAAVGLDRPTLARAIRVVQEAFSRAGRSPQTEEFAGMVASVYQFYLDNASGAGAEALVNGLVEASA